MCLFENRLRKQCCECNKGPLTQCCKSVKNMTLVRSIRNTLIDKMLLYMVRDIQSMFVYTMSLYISQKTWACGLWYKVNKSMFIYKMLLYISQKTWACSMFLNISLEIWTQRVWHQVYKMHRVLNNANIIIIISDWYVCEFNSLATVMFWFVLGVCKTQCTQCIITPNQLCNI